MAVLKAYTNEFGLVKSIPIQSTEHLRECIYALAQVASIRKIYLTTGKQSEEIHFTQYTKNKRPTYYTSPDGKVFHTISIHPHNHPMKPHHT